jgi:hypothetical protein
MSSVPLKLRGKPAERSSVGAGKLAAKAAEERWPDDNQGRRKTRLQGSLDGSPTMAAFVPRNDWR